MAPGMPFDLPEAKKLNISIIQMVYHGFSDLAACDGPYGTCVDSLAEQGSLQYDDLWGVTPADLWDWSTLKAKTARAG